MMGGMESAVVSFVLKALSQVQASDIFLRGERVWLRVPEGVVEAISLPDFSREEIRAFVRTVQDEGFVPKEYLKALETRMAVDFAASLAGLKMGDEEVEIRLRFHASYSRGDVFYTIRLIPPPAKDLMDLGIDPAVAKRLQGARGLFLVTGPTGAGKSTTLAAILQGFALAQPVHILTFEDPIEYVIAPGKAVVHQKELHSDFYSFAEGLKGALRESPDIVMVGEVRDLETLRWTLSLAEAGFLVLASYHTRSPQETVERIIGSFPDHEQNQARMRLATSLVGVLSQVLLPANGPSARGAPGPARRRVVAYEYMFANPAIRTLIRDNKTQGLLNAISGEVGVRFEDSLARLVRTGMVQPATAFAAAPDPNLLRQKIDHG